MNIFGKFLGKKDAGQEEGSAAVPEMSQADLMKVMQSPQARQFMSELQSRLSKEDQKHLVHLALSRDPQRINEFLKSRIPDWETMLKNAGLDR